MPELDEVIELARKSHGDNWIIFTASDWAKVKEIVARVSPEAVEEIKATGITCSALEIEG